MKTQMNNTSLSTYRENVLPASSRMEAIVLGVFEKIGDSTNQEIADYLNWPINRVTGRTNNLVTKRGLLTHKGIKYVNNRQHTIWGLVTIEENGQSKLF